MAVQVTAYPGRGTGTTIGQKDRRPGPATPPAVWSSHPFAWISDRLTSVRSARRSRLRSEMMRRAAWAEEARNTPRLSLWIEQLGE